MAWGPAIVALATSLAAAHPLKLDLSSIPDARVPRESAIERPIEVKTAVEHRFAGGAVGQAGYLCGLGGIGPDGEAARSGAEGAFGRSGAFLGASLALPIR
jgi:hypothetical protein